jgi:hypothetical protein
MRNALLSISSLTLSGCFFLFGPSDPGRSPPFSGQSGGGTAGGSPFFTPDANFGGGFGGGACDPGTLASSGPAEESSMPPPISGGTLAALSDGHTVVAADPDRDVVWVVDTQTGSSQAVQLVAHDEPGRVLQDGHGRVHVVLRRAGAIVQIDPASATVVFRRPVCSDARGIAWQSSTDTLTVACATGELATLPAAGGVGTQLQRLGGDLRDVVSINDALFVTRFRSAEVIPVTTGAPTMHAQSRSIAAPVAPTTGVGWRTIATPNGSLLMSHQLETTATIDIGCSAVSSYGGNGGFVDAGFGSGAVVASGLTVFSGGQATAVQAPIPGVLPVDVALSADCQRLAVVSAGSKQVLEIGAGTGGCAYEVPGTQSFLYAFGATAAVYLPNGNLVIQQREPAAIQVVHHDGTAPDTWALAGGTIIENTGHTLFHQDSSRGIACASCHPEGREDGLTWQFDKGLGSIPRRTQSLSGGLLATAPFHWDGDMPALDALMLEVFVHRMGGTPPSADQVVAVGNWLNALPKPASAPALDPDAVTRGYALFNEPSVGCTVCHSGSHFTSNSTIDVGTGDGPLQVPSLLGVSARAPYLHDGCAPTLRERFTLPCGGGDAHGRTSQLTSAQLDDLIAYLNTL